jgi:hypothetical protein
MKKITTLFVTLLVAFNQTAYSEPKHVQSEETALEISQLLSCQYSKAYQNDLNKSNPLKDRYFSSLVNTLEKYLVENNKINKTTKNFDEISIFGLNASNVKFSSVHGTMHVTGEFVGQDENKVIKSLASQGIELKPISLKDIEKSNTLNLDYDYGKNIKVLTFIKAEKTPNSYQDDLLITEYKLTPDLSNKKDVFIFECGYGVAKKK